MISAVLLLRPMSVTACSWYVGGVTTQTLPFVLTLLDESIVNDIDEARAGCR